MAILEGVSLTNIQTAKSSGAALQIGTSTSHNVELLVGDVVIWSIDTGSQKAFFPNVANSYNIGLSSKPIGVLYTSAIIFAPSGSFGDIYQSTTDGSDTKVVRIGGGGDVINTRGGLISLYGNEHANLGRVTIEGGNAGGEIRFAPNGTERWRFASDGTFIPLSDNAYQIGNSSFHILSIYTSGVYSQDGGTMDIVQVSNNDLRFHTNNTFRWQVNLGGHLIPANSGQYNIGSSTACVLNVYTEAIQFRDLGAQAIHYIKPLTSSGSDYDIVWILGGGGTGGDRGASLRLSGDDSPSYGGGASLSSSDDSDARINNIRFMGGSTGSAGENSIWTNWNNTHDIGSSSSNQFRHIWAQQFYQNGTALNTNHTAKHSYQSDAAATLIEGECVKLVNRKVVRCTTANDPTCIGLWTTEEVDVDVARANDPDDRVEIYDSFGAQITTGKIHRVAAGGDSVSQGLTGARVCDEGGAVSAGDYLCTSSSAGFLMKQADDIKHTYTVAQAIEDVTFDVNGEATGAYVYLLKS